MNANCFIFTFLCLSHICSRFLVSEVRDLTYALLLHITVAGQFPIFTGFTGFPI